MKVLLAFDSFKGSLGAVEACSAAAEGISDSGCEYLILPLSDGGEGFLDAVDWAMGGRRVPLRITGPLFERREAELLLLDDGRTAVVEAAMACGLGLVPPASRSAAATTTLGVGEMIAAAVSLGAEKIIVGLGGSAGNDGGMGMLSALGWRFHDDAGAELNPTGMAMAGVRKIVPGERLQGIEVVAACDVDNPFTGIRGSANIYAAQKGAAPEEIAELEKGALNYSTVMAETTGETPMNAVPGSGAAGGLGYALMTCLSARSLAGAELLMDMADFDEFLKDVDLCLTGEGMTDAQTINGKLPARVASRCRRAGVACIVMSGALGNGWRSLYGNEGVTAILSISSGPRDKSDAMKDAAVDVADAARTVIGIYAAARHLPVGTAIEL